MSMGKELESMRLGSEGFPAYSGYYNPADYSMMVRASQVLQDANLANITIQPRSQLKGGDVHHSTIGDARRGELIDPARFAVIDRSKNHSWANLGMFEIVTAYGHDLVDQTAPVCTTSEQEQIIDRKLRSATQLFRRYPGLAEAAGNYAFELAAYPDFNLFADRIGSLVKLQAEMLRVTYGDKYAEERLLRSRFDRSGDFIYPLSHFPSIEAFMRRTFQEKWEMKDKTLDTSTVVHMITQSDDQSGHTVIQDVTRKALLDVDGSDYPLGVKWPGSEPIQLADHVHREYLSLKNPYAKNGLSKVYGSVLEALEKFKENSDWWSSSYHAELMNLRKVMLNGFMVLDDSNLQENIFGYLQETKDRDFVLGIMERVAGLDSSDKERQQALIEKMTQIVPLFS